MKKIFGVLIAMVSVLGITSLYLSSCGGGGGGDDTAAPPTNGAGAGGVVIFYQHYGAGFGGGESVQETKDGGFVLTGTMALDASSSQDIYALKTDKNGAVLWSNMYGGISRDDGHSIQQTSDGGFIIGGCGDCSPGPGPGQYNFYLLKLDENGGKVWDQVIPGSSLNGAYAARETMSNGNSTGYVLVGSDTNLGVSLIKTSPTGSVLWQKSFKSNTPWDVGLSVEQTADGGYIIAGDYGSAQIWLIKTDASGNILWDKTLGPGEGFSVKETADGYIIAGRTTIRTFSAPSNIIPGDAVVIKTDSAGNEVWRRTFGGPEDDEAHSVALAKDGGYIIAGKTLSYSTGPVDYNMSWQWEDVFLIKLTSNGSTSWQKVKGHAPNISDGGSSVYAVSDGGYIVTGNSNAWSAGSVLLMKTDKNGDTVNLGENDLTITVPSAGGIINFTNATDVASTGVMAIKNPRDVGSYALGLLIASLKNEPVTNICASGSYSFSPAVTSLAPGSTFTLTLADCVDDSSTPSQTISGTGAISISYVSGDPLTATYTLQTTISALTISAVETGGTLTTSITGGMYFSQASTAGSLVEQSQWMTSPATRLTVAETENGALRAIAMGPFLLSDSINTAGAYSYGTADQTCSFTATFAGANAGTDLVVTVVTPIFKGAANPSPASGSFTVKATDNSSVTAVITNGVVDLAVDTNGDGTVDGHLSVPWSLFD